MTTARIEILVEPFKEGAPGPHVMAVVEALEGAGLTVDMGPFSTVAEGELAALLDVVAPVTQAALDAGASSIQTRLERL